MQDQTILWVDHRYSKNASCSSHLANDYKIAVISDSAMIPTAIHRHQPKILCFDFDFPDQAGLETLQQSKHEYSDIPFVMLTKDDSGELANWALRLRVWDYFIKPVVGEKLASSFDMLLGMSSSAARDSRENYMLQPEIPAGIRSSRTNLNGAPTAAAISYIRKNLDKKITLDQVANLCGMSKSHFCRSFKAQHNITFQVYLCQQRMNKAVSLLVGTNMMVTQIAMAVGVTEHSNFTRTFQKYIGLGPSEYRKAVLYQNKQSLTENTL